MLRNSNSDAEDDSMVAKQLEDIWSNMNGVALEDSQMKSEPCSPNGISQCMRQSPDVSTSSYFFVDYPSHDSYGSDERSYQDDSPDSGDSPASLDNGNSADYSSTSILVGLEQDGQNDARRLCLVCGDIASGYHYGVSSCEACKAFFKRTIQGNIEYSCPATGDCAITKRRRKACQACRFQKCLNVGMLREGVRLDRVRGGRQKYKRSPESDTVHLHPVSSSVKKPYKDSSENWVLSTLLILESQLEKLFAHHDGKAGDLDEMTRYRVAISDLADRELAFTVSWAKAVPGFSSLSLLGQMDLLQRSWLEILCLNLVFRSCPYDGYVRHAEDLCIPVELVDTYKIPKQLDSITRKLCEKFTDLGVTLEEYVLLKGIMLCNIGVKLDPDNLIRGIEKKLHDSLIGFITLRYGANSHRLGQLFLLLPPITHMKLLAKQFWLDLKDTDNVIMHKLFLEMLEADS